MDAKLVIEQLIKTITEKQCQDEITKLEDIIVKQIAEVSKEKLFYSLPFDEISNLIKKVEFSNKDKFKEPIKLLQDIIENISAVHKKEAILLLNEIQIDHLPKLTIDDIIGILSKFTQSQLLTTLGKLMNDENSCVVPDYDYMIDELKQKTKELEEQIQQQIKEEKILPKEFTEELPKLTFESVTDKPYDFIEDIFDAAEAGDLESVQYHLEVLHADKEATCERIFPKDKYPYKQLTILHIAAAFGYLPIVQYLCEIQKVNIEATNAFKETPLFIACETGQLQIVRYFCEIAHANKRAVSICQDSILAIACLYGHLPIVRYLCEVQNMYADEKNNLGDTPLFRACNGGCLQIVQYLCEVHHANPDEEDHDGFTPLHCACDHGHLHIIKYLHEVQNANLNVGNEEAPALLEYSPTKDYPDIVQYLLDNINE